MVPYGKNLLKNSPLTSLSSRKSALSQVEMKASWVISDFDSVAPPPPLRDDRSRNPQGRNRSRRGRTGAKISTFPRSLDRSRPKDRRWMSIHAAAGLTQIGNLDGRTTDNWRRHRKIGTGRQTDLSRSDGGITGCVTVNEHMENCTYKPSKQDEYPATPTCNHFMCGGGPT